MLDRLVEAGWAVLSAWCLSEFFAVVTRRLPEPPNPTEALALVDRLARTRRVLGVTPAVTAVVVDGCRGRARPGLGLRGVTHN